MKAIWPFITNTSLNASLFCSTHESEFLVLHLRARYVYNTQPNM